MASVSVNPNTELRGGRAGGLDAEHVRADFPILGLRVHGKPLVYLDNAATTQKPKAVLEAMDRYYASQNANIHRGVHALSVEATTAYESARSTIARFVHATRPEEIVFVRGATEGINLVAQSFARPRLNAGDEIVISAMEHHSNIVPWQLLCQQTGARLRVIPMTDAGELLLDEYAGLLTERTKLVAVVHVSNALGTVNPVAEMVAQARQRGIPVLIDGAQAVPHMAVDVQELGCDFYVFSGHKVFGPTGIGAVWGRYDLWQAMPPYQGGGDMIRSVTFEKTTYADPPYRFEAGTPHIAGVIGFAAAIEYVSELGMDRIASYETGLLDYTTAALSAIPGVRLIGTAEHRASVVSFIVDGIHPHDVGTVLDQEGIAIRTGHHCAQPVMDRLGIPATARASLAFYNTAEEIDALAAGVRRAIEMLG